MAETSVHKVNSASSPKGKMGQMYLACGIALGMRLWENVAPGKDHPTTERDYETAGYVIHGRAELRLAGRLFSSSRAIPGSCPAEQATITAYWSLLPPSRRRIPRQ
jgi:hypothetical protein